MLEPHGTLLPLWDYGWCEYEQVHLPDCHSPKQFINQYRQSVAFGSTSLGSEHSSVMELHGPFWSSSILSTHFELITQEKFQELIVSIPIDSGFVERPTQEQWKSIQSLVSQIIHRHTWFFFLRLTEDDQAFFHDWGFVYWLFREFICASPGSDFAERLVFGYD